MNTIFFLNTTDLKTFMSAKGAKFEPMPIDEKNITTDWIDSLFDDDEFVMQHGEWLGWIEGCPMRVTISGNIATFHALDNTPTKNGGDPYNVATTVDEILQEGNEDENDLLAIITYCDSTGATSVAFYYEDHSEQTV